MNCKVFKFGGASVKDAEGIKNLRKILALYPNTKLIVVISAMGKTTNLMEKILDAWYFDAAQLPALCQTLKVNHYQVIYDLGIQSAEIIAQLNRFFNKLSQILSESPSGNYDFDYDKIVSFGEYLSTTMVSSYLNFTDVPNVWMDASKLIRTDNTYREGKVHWEVTVREISEQISETFSTHSDMKVVITQGFIGGTSEQLRTTLGREGSDYSAAVFAYSLEAEDVTIWKDVPGLLNADPKLFPDAVKIDAIPYSEAIELAYYGASVIHPKTLKPIQNKGIPLYVKSFFAPEQMGSVVSKDAITTEIPSYIIKKNQVLISISPKDFSFITVETLLEIFGLLNTNKINLNLMQNSALSFSICVDDKPHRIKSLIAALTLKYTVKFNDMMELITIRHYNRECIEKLLKNRIVMLEQKNRTTYQALVKN